MSRIRPHAPTTRSTARAARPLLVALLAATLGGAGCAAHVAPGLVAGSPEESGIVVVVAAVDPAMQSAPELAGTTLYQTQLSRAPVDDGAIVPAGAPDSLIAPRNVGGVLVFSGLAPGFYTVRRLVLGRQFLERDSHSRIDFFRDRAVFEFDPAASRNLTFHVARGGLTYVGTIVVHADFAVSRFDEVAGRAEIANTGDRVSCGIEPDTDHERNVWGMLLRWYRGTPWQGAIEARLHALGPPGGS
ncbi:MAG: hypothetical protein ACM3JJ_12815 [Hyphomicrobiales bacterium]